MKRSTRILLLGGLLLLSVLLWLASLFFELVTKEVSLGADPQASANPYLAAEHFLQAQGRKVQRLESPEQLRQLESQGQSLLILGNRKQFSPQQNEHLLAWAEEGGHLVIVASQAWDEDTQSSGDALLDSLGIRRYSAQKLDPLNPQREDASRPVRNKKVSTREPVTDSTQPDPALTRLYLENEAEPAYFNLCNCSHLHDEYNLAHAWANNAKATTLLQLYQGDGVITIINDASIWKTNQLGLYDHAWLLWYLTQDTDVTLLSKTISEDNLLALLLRHFPLALTAAALLILLLLWRNASRQGPIISPAAVQRRSLLEHVQANAEFLLRHQGQAYLLRRLQHDLLQRARRCHPGFERLTPLQQRGTLATLCQQSTSLVNQAMAAPGSKPLRAAEFTEKVRQLQILRNAL